MALVLKTRGGKTSVGSNPTSVAIWVDSLRGLSGGLKNRRMKDRYLLGPPLHMQLQGRSLPCKPDGKQTDSNCDTPESDGGSP